MTAVTRILSIALLLLFASVVQAVPIVTYNAGVATGIQGLVVGATTYDVSFKNGSYNTVFASDAPTFLGNEPAADAAADAILFVMQGEPPVPHIDAAISASEVLWVATAVNGSLFEAEQVGHNGEAGPWQRFGDFSGDPAIDYTGFSWLFATFSEVSAAPEPATFMLLGLGLAGLGWNRRRK